MKKYFALIYILGCFTQPAWAADINTLQSLGQAEFRLFSEDLGAALSYKSATPAEPLGITGFELSVGVTSTEMKSSQLWTKATGSSKGNLIVPKLFIYKGLPFNIDIAAFYSPVPTTNIKLAGLELRYAVLEGGVAMPAIAVRGAMTRLSGVDQLSLNTKSMDISISKGFAIFTPYAGVGSVWVDSTPNGVATLASESFHQGKFFGGVNINVGISNFLIEYDKTGSSASYTAKLGFRF